MNKRLIAAFLALGLTAQAPPNLGAPPASAVISGYDARALIQSVKGIAGRQ